MTTIQTYLNCLRLFSQISPKKTELRRGEYIVLILVITLFDKNKGVVTKNDVVLANDPFSANTTYTYLDGLIEKGYLTSNRPSKQFFSKSYLGITAKAVNLKHLIEQSYKGILSL
jgi:hypothetical protein